MLQFAVAHLLHHETVFQIPSSLGKWEFGHAAKDPELLSAIGKSMCANTYFASLDQIDLTSSDSDFKAACDEIIDICLLLSFLTGGIYPGNERAGQEGCQTRGG